jgi:serine/threonine protein kinase
VLDAGGHEPLIRVVCRNCGQKNLLQRTFDHFVPVETLGAGGMGTVYKARDTQLERFVALKLLHKNLTNEADHDAQLQQEARIAASVNHPNVVQIFSLGMDHGQFYVVMELIDHGSLDDLMESQGRLPEHQVLDIGIQIARGLRAAHRKGLIHRDVKPANILFVDEQAAKIGDFGLAAFATQQSQRTEGDRVIWGTPPYVAPERLCAQPETFAATFTALAQRCFMPSVGRRQSKAAQLPPQSCTN